MKRKCVVCSIDFLPPLVGHSDIRVSKRKTCSNDCADYLKGVRPRKEMEIRPGATLQNGSTVVLEHRISGTEWVVLCVIDTSFPYAIWRCNRYGDAYVGDYTRDFKEAQSIFYQRSK